mmetsp:Transcript_26316/g.81961  ORF Transcript_26316/g.81961 Transcript_26316/m.81961 type:complete len:378 (-) Transcript_26316:180-1313(-)
MREDLETQLRLRRKRTRAAERAKRECVRAVESFLPTLRARLASLVDTNAAIKRLKELRNDPSYKHKRLEMWEELKASAFVRWVAMLYALTMLNLLLRLQMHVLGRQSLLDERPGPGEEPELPGAEGGEEGEGAAMNLAERHRLLSLTYEYLLGDGLKTLADAVRGAVAHALQDWTVATQKKVPFGDFRAVVQDMRAFVEAGGAADRSAGSDPGAEEDHLDAADGEGAAASPLIKFLVHPQARTAAAQSAPVRRCLQETWDLAESPFFLCALQESLDRVFELALDSMRGRYFEADAGVVNPETNPAAEAPRAGAGGEPILLQPPLAHIITAIQKESTKILDTTDDGRCTADSALYIAEIGKLESVNALCNAAFGLEEL